MRVGYTRVSTADQNRDLQEDALHKAGCEKIFRDIAGGAVDSRKGLAEAIEYVRDGDTLVVWKLPQHMKDWLWPNSNGNFGRENELVVSIDPAPPNYEDTFKNNVAYFGWAHLQRHMRWRGICNGDRWHIRTRGVPYLKAVLGNVLAPA